MHVTEIHLLSTEVWESSDNSVIVINGPQLIKLEQKKSGIIIIITPNCLFLYLSQLFHSLKGARDAATLNRGALTEKLATLLCSPALQARGNSSHYWKYARRGGHSRKTSRKSNSCNREISLQQSQNPYRAHPRAVGQSTGTMSAKVTEAGIQALAKGVLESEECVNNVVDLLEHLQVSSMNCLLLFFIPLAVVLVGKSAGLEVGLLGSIYCIRSSSSTELPLVGAHFSPEERPGSLSGIKQCCIEVS